MGKCLLLDCTLRDGGYVNNWQFGDEVIKGTIKGLEESGVDIIEIGFLRDEMYNSDRAIFNDIIIPNKYISKKDNIQYSVMGEIFNAFPLDKLKNKSETNIDIIRIIVWKKMIPEAIEYCKKIVDKGYKVCIQPDRVNQYTITEFQEMVKKFSQINPYAIYVVDSNGVLCRKQLIEYLKAADEVLPYNIKLGYHGHNNLLQAEGTAENFVELELERDIIIDGTIRGIGRSSGNLNIEIFAKYLNDYYKTSYKIESFINLYSNYIHKIYEEKSWGYTFETFITSYKYCNPNYATILKNEYHLSYTEISGIIELLSETDKVITNRNGITNYIERYRKING